MMCANKTELQPRSQRLFKIKYEDLVPSMGVLEPKTEIFQGKYVIVPYALTRGTSPEEIVVANMTGEVRFIEEGEVLAEIHKVREVVEDNKVLKIKSEETKHEGNEEEATFDLDPKLPVVKREALISLLEEFKDPFAWNKDQIGQKNLCELSILLID